MLSLVRPDDVMVFWPNLKKGFQKGLDRFFMNEYTIDEVLELLMTGKCQLWISHNVSAVTDILAVNDKKYLNIWLATGSDTKNWRHVLDDMLLFAEENGCDSLIIDCVPAMAAIAEKYGFKTYQRRLRMPIHGK
jgi:hypothetical protein